MLVTGHTGFKGAWLSRWLARAGAEVTGVSLAAPVSTPSLFDEAALGETLAASVAADICDARAITQVVRQAAPVVVFHLAAQALVRPSYRDPIGTWMANTMGTAHLLEAVRTAQSVRAVVVCTTDKCYENLTPGHPPFRESDPLGGFDPYSSSKAGAELVAASWRRSFFSDPGAAAIATARAGNVIGGGDFAEDRLIPDLVRHWRAGSETPIRNPNATRPWQHVLEPLSGYLRLAEQLWAGDSAAVGSWNFGPAMPGVQSVRWVANRVSQVLEGVAWTDDGTLHPHEAATLSLDCAKAQRELAWVPTWNLTTALNRTAAWYHGWNTLDRTLVAGPDRAARVRSLMDDDLAAFMADTTARAV